MDRIRVLALVCAPTLACASVLALGASPAQAIGTLNSECVTGTDGFGIINSAAEWAQTFPAKHSGKLLTVDLLNYARAPGGAGGDVNIQLYGTDETGTPVEPVLASTTVPTASIAADNATTITPRTSRRKRPLI